MVLERSLAGPIGVSVKFSTLQEYGVDKVFFLENNNADTSQRNVVFVARGEGGQQAKAIAGRSLNVPLVRASLTPPYSIHSTNGFLK